MTRAERRRAAACPHRGCRLESCRPAVIRPHRDGWLIFLRARYAWYGTPEAAADALLAGHHGNGIRIGLR